VLVTDTSTGTGAVDGKIDNYRVESVGVFNIETDIDLNQQNGGFALVGKVRARSTSLLK
jgi:translocation and assembly module TamB